MLAGAAAHPRHRERNERHLGQRKHTLPALLFSQHRNQHGIITRTSTPISGVKSVLDALNLNAQERRE